MSKIKAKYENNPFFIATNGITLLITLAQGVAIFLIVLSLFNYIRDFTGSEPDTTPRQQVESAIATTSSYGPSEWLIATGAVFIIIAAMLLVSALLGGVSSYTSARLARGHKVKLTEAFRAAFDNVFPYLWLQIVIFVKLLLWALLFIIPAFIMAIRYSLAGVAFFDTDKQLRGNAAVKESLRLTKGAWVTTFSANALLNLLTLGVFSPLVTTAVNTVLYRQYTSLDKHEKPSAHILAWITLLLPLVFISVLVFAALTFIASAGIAELFNRIP